MTTIGPVQSDVPLPSTRGALRTALAELEPGQCRLIVGYTRRHIYTAAERNGISVRVRAEGAGLRVWRAC